MAERLCSILASISLEIILRAKRYPVIDTAIIEMITTTHIPNSSLTRILLKEKFISFIPLSSVIVYSDHYKIISQLGDYVKRKEYSERVSIKLFRIY